MAQKLQRLLIVTGPESSGKTTLARALANRLGVPMVEEMARAYLEARDPDQGDYGPGDLVEIARLQHNAEQSALLHADTVVADTDQLVIDLWWQEKYGDAAFDAPVSTHIGPQPKRDYLLCYPDLDWEPDPLRENPLDRHRLFKLQMQKLETMGAAYRVIWGQREFRTRLGWQYVEAVLAE